MWGQPRSLVADEAARSLRELLCWDDADTDTDDADTDAGGACDLSEFDPVARMGQLLGGGGPEGEGQRGPRGGQQQSRRIGIMPLFELERAVKYAMGVGQGGVGQGGSSPLLSDAECRRLAGNGP